MPTETELKLRIEPEQIDKFKQHPLLRTTTHTTPPQHLYNTYFDTIDHQLLQHGIGLRVRQIGEQRIQTIKTAGVSLGGLHQRNEWEIPISSDTPDYNQVPPDILPNWCTDENKQKQIIPLFVTDFMRTTWYLVLDKEKSEIEIALDQGKIKTATDDIPFHEIELELKTGTPDQLYQVALKLQKALSLRVEKKSKAAVGYLLHKSQQPQFHKAGAVDLTSTMTAEQAFIHIIQHCLEHLQANEDVVLSGNDPEGVHQMRVALRRLHSCLNLYQPLIPKSSHTKLRSQLKWLADILGVARDWDVFALALPHMQPPDDNLLLDLSTKITDLRTHAYNHIQSTLRSPEYSRFLLSLGKWLNQRRWRRNLEMRALQSLEQPIGHFANQVLQSQYQKLCRQEKPLSHLNAKQRHKLRISVKKMNYAIRFFKSLYPQPALAAFAKPLSQLQEQLGTLNDAKMITELLKQIRLAEQASIRQWVKKSYKGKKPKNLDKLEKIWQNFLEQEQFWNLTTESYLSNV